MLRACVVIALVIVCAPAFASDVTLVPDWLVGSWRLIDIYTFDNSNPADKTEYKRGLRSMIGQDVLTYKKTSFDFSSTHVSPGGGVDVFVSELRPSFRAYVPFDMATSIDSKKKISVAVLKSAISIETQRCYNQDDRSDEGRSSDCTGTLVAREAASNRIIVYFVSGTSKHPIIPCLWEYERKPPSESPTP